MSKIKHTLHFLSYINFIANLSAIFIGTVFVVRSNTIRRV